MSAIDLDQVQAHGDRALLVLSPKMSEDAALAVVTALADLDTVIAELRDARAALAHVHLMAQRAAAGSRPRSRQRQLAEALLATVDGLVSAP
jgi:hypothetical protein